MTAAEREEAARTFEQCLAALVAELRRRLDADDETPGRGDDERG